MAPDALKELIRDRIKCGYLPREHTIELWQGGASFGHVCDACGAAIASNDPMGLLCGDNWSLIRFHLDCFKVWAFERNREADVEQTA